MRELLGITLLAVILYPLTVSAVTFERRHDRTEEQLTNTVYIDCIGQYVHLDLTVNFSYNVLEGESSEAIDTVHLHQLTRWAGYIFTEDYNYSWRVRGPFGGNWNINGSAHGPQVGVFSNHSNVRAEPLGDNPFSALTWKSNSIYVLDEDGYIVNKHFGDSGVPFNCATD